VRWSICLSYVKTPFVSCVWIPFPNHCFVRFCKFCICLALLQENREINLMHSRNLGKRSLFAICCGNFTFGNFENLIQAGRFFCYHKVSKLFNKNIFYAEYLRSKQRLKLTVSWRRRENYFILHNLQYSSKELISIATCKSVAQPMVCRVTTKTTFEGDF